MLPAVGDVLYRAHAYVGDTRLAVNVVYVFFERWEVVRTTEHKMWLAAPGTTQPWEALPGCAEEGRIELTEAQVMERIRESSVKVCYRRAKVMFAWPTKELALVSLRARTGWRVVHARRELDRALAIQAFIANRGPDEVELKLEKAPPSGGSDPQRAV